MIDDFNRCMGISRVAFTFFNSHASEEEIKEAYMDEADKLFLSGKYSGKLEVALWRPKFVGCEVSPGLFNFVQNSSVLPILPFNSKRQMAGIKPTRLLDMKYAMASMRVGTSEQSAEYLNGVLGRIYQEYESGNAFSAAIVCKNSLSGDWNFYNGS